MGDLEEPWLIGDRQWVGMDVTFAVVCGVGLEAAPGGTVRSRLALPIEDVPT